MTPWVATTSLGTAGTGVVVATPGFQGKQVEIKVSQRFGVDDPEMHFCLGWSDGTRQNCDSLFADGVTFNSKKVTNKIVSLYEKQGGVLVEVLSASFHSFTATQLKLNVLTANPSYQVSISILG